MKPVTVEGCTAFGKVYHKECFKCCVCKRRIDGKFFQKNGKPYCEKDYAKIVEECCVCKQPIKGDCIGKSNFIFKITPLDGSHLSPRLINLQSLFYPLCMHHFYYHPWRSDWSKGLTFLLWLRSVTRHICKPFSWPNHLRSRYSCFHPRRIGHVTSLYYMHNKWSILKKESSWTT